MTGKKKSPIINIVGFRTVTAPTAKVLWIDAVYSIAGDSVCDKWQPNIIT